MFLFNRKERKELVSFENAENAKLCGDVFLFQFFLNAFFCHFDGGEITRENPHRNSPIFVDKLV